MLSTIVKVTGVALLLGAALHVYAQTPAQQHSHDHSHSQAAQHAAHIHGVAQLQVSVEGDQLYIALTAPADTLLGFDGAPASAEQQARAQTVKNILSEPQVLWALPTTAECQVASSEVAWPSAAQLAAHSNIAAQWQLLCAKPDQLTTLQLSLWQQFPGLETLGVEFVTDTAAGARALTRADTQLELR